MERTWYRSAVIGAVLAVPAPIAAQEAEPFAEVRASIEEALAGGVPSLAVAVARDGKIVWEEGFGLADRERDIAADEHTMYSLASISKPVTATGLMVLVERGEVDLDRPINDYLGEAKLVAHVGEASEATVRRVANHTSGLWLHYQFFYEDEPYRPPGMDETIRRYGHLVAAPGEYFQYSNLGYGVLDHVIARVAETSYADFMQKEVFEPLGLTRTSVGIGPGHEEHHAIRYDADGDPIPFYDFDHRGASAVYSSAHDLVRLGMFHLKAHLEDQRPILTDASIEAMQEQRALPLTGYGVGWGIGETSSGQRVVRHSGGMGGVSTTLWLVPEANLAVTVLSNGNSSWPGRLAERIVNELLPNRSGEADAEEPETPEEDPEVPRQELVGTWSGAVSTYQGERTFTLEIGAKGSVRTRIDDQKWSPVQDPVFDGPVLTGRLVRGDIGTDDANRRRYRLHLFLVHRGETMNGALFAVHVSGKRTGNALSHWVEVERQAAKD